MAATQLTGAPVPVVISVGYSLTAPGLRGTVTELSARASATRSDGGTHEARLEQALRGADIVDTKVFEIEVAAVDRSVVSRATRSGVTRSTASGEPAMVLRTASLGDATEQAVLYTDEAGVTRWIFPATQAATGVEFLLPLESAEMPPAAATTTRGALTKLGRRLVKVLAWATEDILGQGALAVARLWESRKHPYGFRRVPFGTESVAWDELQKGRALLLIHGTFSTAEASFGQLPAETVASLARLYDGRIFAFDHPSLYHSPADNVREMLEMLPAGADLELDIVTHSRGGLVGRELTERLEVYSPGGRRLRVRRAIFVAAPQRGTILTDSQHGIAMLDRYTNLFTDLPDDAFTISMEALFMLGKLLYHGACHTLPGILSMVPVGAYLRDLNASPNHSAEYFAVAADFKPRAASALTRFGWAVADALIDGVFAEPNDGVVPTAGSYQLAAEAAGFPIDATHRLVFGEETSTHHCNYFGKSALQDKLVEWLGAS